MVHVVLAIAADALLTQGGLARYLVAPRPAHYHFMCSRLLTFVDKPITTGNLYEGKPGGERIWPLKGPLPQDGPLPTQDQMQEMPSLLSKADHAKRHRRRNDLVM